MCVIINNENGRNIPDSILREAVRSNPHGGGIYDVDTHEVFHTMSMPRMFNEMRRRHRWIAHCRYATVGPKSLGNCHPYEVVPGWFLMMNGTVRVNTPKGWSDTRAVAAMLAGVDQSKWEHILSYLPARFLFWEVGQPATMTGHGWLTDGGVDYSKKLVPRREIGRLTRVNSLLELGHDEDAGPTSWEKLALFEREMLDENDTHNGRNWNAY